MTQEGAPRDLVEVLSRRAQRFGRWPALQHRPAGKGLAELSWQDWLEDGGALASALRALEVRPGQRIGILSPNRTEWLLADLGGLMAGAVVVPIQWRASSGARAGMLRAARPRVVFLGGAEALARIAEHPEGLEDVPHLVVFDDPAEAAAPPTPIGLRGRLYRFSDVLVRGRAIVQRGDGLRPGSSGRGPDDPATLVFTAGASDHIKGVVVTHRQITDKLVALRDRIVLPRGATQLMVMPLDSIFGRIMAWAAIDQGATTYIASPDRPLRDELDEARPHFIAGGPRTFEKLRDVILTRRAGALGVPGRATLGLTERQLAQAQGGRRRGVVGGLEQTLARQALRTRIRHLLGGRVRHLVGGGGHLDERTRALFELGGHPIMEGYGLSESIGVATAKAPGEPPGPSVGRPIPGIELRLSPEGEILLRGPGLLAGYLVPARDAADPVEVTPAADAEGWFHTGDLGLVEDGALVLTGRREDLLHLATGTVVSPAPIERALIASGLATHAVACGEGQPFVGVLLWPGADARGEPAEPGSPEPPGPDPAAIRRLLEEVNRGLGRGEQIHDFRVVAGRLSPERGELSSRGEPVRPVIHRRYREIIDSMYSGTTPVAPR